MAVEEEGSLLSSCLGVRALASCASGPLSLPSLVPPNPQSSAVHSEHLLQPSDFLSEGTVQPSQGWEQNSGWNSGYPSPGQHTSSVYLLMVAGRAVRKGLKG